MHVVLSVCVSLCVNMSVCVVCVCLCEGVCVSMCACVCLYVYTFKKVSHHVDQSRLKRQRSSCFFLRERELKAWTATSSFLVTCEFKVRK